jgi:hypothetical protein
MWGEMPVSVDHDLKLLRRTITPYKGQIAIFSVITIFLLIVAYRSSQWALAWSPIVIWAGFAVLAYFGLRYKVLWDGNGVVMCASGVGEKRIPYDEIAEIRIERADVSEFMAQARPFRRIVVYGNAGHPVKSIDISLRHFRPRDIDELLREIRIRRPDLVVPAIPWGEGSDEGGHIYDALRRMWK